MKKNIPVTYIEQIKQIAYTSPYVSGRKNWDIIVIKDRKLIKKIAEVVREHIIKIKNNIRKDFRTGFLEYAQKYTVFESAPVLFIPTFRITSTMSFMLNKADTNIYEWERDSYIKSISCVSMLIILAAESLGLGSCYMTGPLIAEEQISKLINVKSERKIGAIIPVGYRRKG